MKIKQIRRKGYEKIFHAKDNISGLNAIISIHNTNRGEICLGGCRMYPYHNFNDMLEDSLGLSKKMTYKNAMANLHFGGSKCVIRADPKQDKNNSLLLAMADFINEFNEKYDDGKKIYTGQDVGITQEDVKIMNERTKYLVKGKLLGSDPGPPTSLGIYGGIKSAVSEIFQEDNLEDLVISVHGLGNVGSGLLKYLKKEKSKIIATDLKKEKIKESRKVYGNKITFLDNPNEIFSESVHVFSPNVPGSNYGGGALDEKRLKKIYQQKIEENLIIAGGTNIVLTKTSLINLVNKLGGLYFIPPEVINAGGVISVASDLNPKATKKSVEKQILGIGDTVREIIIKSRKTGKPINEITEQLVNERIYDFKK